MPILIHGAGLTAEEIGALPLAGGTMMGDINASGHDITFVRKITGDPDGNLRLDGSGAYILIDNGGVDLQNNPLIGLPTPTDPTAAANKAYVDYAVASDSPKIGSVIRAEGEPLKLLSVYGGSLDDGDQIIFYCGTSEGEPCEVMRLTSAGAELYPWMRIMGLTAPTDPTDAANKAYVDSHLPQYVKLTTEGDDGKASYILPVGNQTFEVGEQVLIPFRFLRGVWSSEKQYECTIEASLHEGLYRICLYAGSNSSEPLGDALVNAKGGSWLYFYDSPTPDKLLYVEVRRIE